MFAVPLKGSPFGSGKIPPDFCRADPLVCSRPPGRLRAVTRSASRARPGGRAQTRASAPQTTDQIWFPQHRRIVSPRNRFSRAGWQPAADCQSASRGQPHNRAFQLPCFKPLQIHFLSSRNDFSRAGWQPAADCQSASRGQPHNRAIWSQLPCFKPLQIHFFSSRNDLSRAGWQPAADCQSASRGQPDSRAFQLPCFPGQHAAGVGLWPARTPITTQ